MPRKLVEGRFELIRVLGEGGMGVVYAARDAERGEVVALKLLRRIGGEELFRFKHEFRALQDLRHPNLVTLRELLADGETWLYTMDLVDGVDLLTWVDGDPERLRAAVIQLAAGLDALHGAGKIHRDIKPSNVLVTRDGRVVLVDFGLVTERDRGDSLDEHIVGTAAYMAPEQTRAGPVGAAADWYAVGCLLYEVLAGRLPFEGTAIDVLMQKLQDEPPPPSTWRIVAADLDALCVDLLRTDPARRPAAAEIVRRLGGGARRAAAPRPLGATTPATAAAVFVGREAEVATLQAAFDDAATGPVTVLVHGESGVGKSTLVRHVTGLLRARGGDVVVLAGRCYERESVRYKAVDGVIDALSRHLARLPTDEAAALAPPHTDVLLQVFPVLRRVEAIARAPVSDEAPDPRERRRRLMAALRELFARLCARRRVVLVVDDLQWADADGLAALGELTRPAGGPPLLLIATGRDLADARGRLVGLRELRLGPLGDAAACELAEALARMAGADDVDVAQVAREAGGHPLFVDELVRHAAEHGGAPTDRLDDALRARVDRLGDDARRVLELLAVAAAPIGQVVLARAAELPLPASQRVLDGLQVARLVRTSGARRDDTAESFHDRVASAALGGLDAAARQARHARLALAFAADRDADPELLAVHWAAAGEPARAASYARQAADAAAVVLAFDRAARLYLKVLELGGGTEDQRLYVALGEVLVGAGRGPEAAGAFLAAASLARAADAAALELRAADQLLRSGYVDEGVASIRRVLGVLGMTYPATPRRALALLLAGRARVRLRGLGYRPRVERDVAPQTLHRIDACYSVSIGLGMVDFVRGAVFQARHLRLSLDAGEPRRVARALIGEAAFIAARGRRAEPRARKLLARAHDLAVADHDAYGEAFSGGAAGIVAFLCGRWRDARDLSDRAEAELRARTVGAAWEISTSQMFSLWASVQLGDLGGLEGRLDQIVADAHARGDLYAATHVAIGHAHMVGLAADDPDRVRAGAIHAMRRWSQAGFQMPHCFDVWAQAQTDLYVDGACGDAAWRRVEAAWPAIRGSMLLRVQLIRVLMHYLRGRAALAVRGDEPAARRAAADAAARLAGDDAGWAQPMAVALRAALAARRRSRWLPAGPGRRRGRLRRRRDGAARGRLSLARARRARRCGRSRRR
ncbi:MAG: AAA family ATPase [Kofleriaceae bacterium]|nr:AAA family ATPase [Kofleriaceae bacterium]